MRLPLFFLFTLSVALTGAAQTIVGKGETLPTGASGDWSATEIVVAGTMKGDRQRPGMSAGRWGLTWKDTTGRADSLTLQWGNTDFGTDGDTRFLRITATGRNTPQDFKAIHTGQEGVALSIKTEGRELWWSVVQDRVIGKGKVDLTAPVDAATIRIFSEGRDLEAEVLKAACAKDPDSSRMTPYTTAADFPEAQDLASSPAGVWHYLDRDTDPAWSRPGGKYTLGIIEENSDGSGRKWTIVYIEGAVTNSDKWEAGMEKGTLTENSFLRNYNLEWEDSMHDRLGQDDECYATLSDDGMILTLHFPLDKATIRLARPL